MEARSQLRHRPTCWRVIQFSRSGEAPVKPETTRKLHMGAVPDALDNFTNGRNDLVRSFEFHVVASAFFFHGAKLT